MDEKKYRLKYSVSILGTIEEPKPQKLIVECDYVLNIGESVCFIREDMGEDAPYLQAPQNCTWFIIEK